MKNKIYNVLAGIALIIVGMGYTGSVFGWWDFRFFSDGWWTFLVIIPSLISIIFSGAGIANVACLAAGTLMFLSMRGMINWEIVSQLAIPILLILVGIDMVLRQVRRKNLDLTNSNTQVYSSVLVNRTFVVEGVPPENNICVSPKYCGIVIDMSRAYIVENINIEVMSMFSGVVIILPENVKAAVPKAVFSNSVKNNFRSCDSPNAPLVYISPRGIAGNVEIK